MRPLLILLLACMFVSVAHAEENVVIPKGIRYKKAPAKVNQEAKQALTKLFSDKTTKQDVLSLFETTTLICGPGLWRNIKTDSTLAELKVGKVLFAVPVLDDRGKKIRTDKQEGKMFQSKDEVLAFWKAFSERSDFTNLKPRKLNPEELTIFWAMIPFDITEPLFILESKKHKILVVFTSADELKISWIDDYQNISVKKHKSPDAGNGK